MDTKKIMFLSFTLICFLILKIHVFGQGVGEPAPDFTLTTTDNSEFNLSENSGKVVFLFLFGYACPHCLANGNNTETGIYNIYKNNTDFVALGIDTWNGNLSGVLNFISQTGITYPVALDGSAVQSLYSTTYDRIIVIDQGGIIRYKSTANATSTVVSEAKQVIDNLFNPTTSIEKSNVNTELFRVFPNPASKNIYIENVYKQSNFTINIISIAGEILYSKELTNQFSNNVINIPINSLNSGVYILQFISPKITQSERIIVTSK